MMYPITLLFVVGASILVSNAAQFKDCGSNLGSIAMVNIENCKDDKDEPCIATPGEEIEIYIYFKTDNDFYEVDGDGSFGDDDIDQFKPCDDPSQYGFRCPLQEKDSRNEFTMIYEVPENTPVGETNMKWRLTDTNSKGVIICASIDILVHKT